MTSLSTVDLRSGYNGVDAVRGVDVNVQAGEVVTIIGSNGAGKSTFLKTLVGLVRPTGGQITMQDQEITRMPTESRVRAGLVLVPEGRHVFPGLTVHENLLLGAYHRRRDASRKDDLERVHGLFPVLAERAKQAAGTLSGGQQQMLAIGRGLMSRPAIMLLDEPSLGLSPQATEEVADRLAELSRLGTTMVLVEQNAEMAFAIAHRGYVFERGSVVAAGPVSELRDDPRVQEAYLGRNHSADPTERGTHEPA